MNFQMLRIPVIIFAATLCDLASAQCCPDGSSPTCSGGGTWSKGPPPSCSNGASPACPSGSPAKGQACTGGNTGGVAAGKSGTESSATGCSVSTGTTCASDGSTRESITSGLTYSSATGKFVGTLKGNQCPPTGNSVNLKSTCVSFDFPMGGEAQWNSPPYAAGLRGTIAWTFTLNYIYGPMDAGFGESSNTGSLCNLLTRSAPEVCNKAGISCCPPGSTAAGCEDKIRYECETGGSQMKSGMFLDKCGLHTQDKYHAHIAPRCEYNQGNPTGHSEIVALALDGYGMYGIWETATTMPDLDACNGHTAVVPSNTQLGITSSSVYHYHFTPYEPFTIGCFGPATSLAECKSLYSECSGSTVTYNARYANGEDYQWTGVLDCPCFYHMNAPASHKTRTLLDPHYNDNIASVDSNGYNTAGQTMAANGYYTDGSGSVTAPAPAPASTPAVAPAPASTPAGAAANVPAPAPATSQAPASAPAGTPASTPASTPADAPAPASTPASPASTPAGTPATDPAQASNAKIAFPLSCFAWTIVVGCLVQR